MKYIFNKLPLSIKLIYIVFAIMLNTIGLVIWLSEFVGKVVIHIAVLDNPCLKDILVNGKE